MHINKLISWLNSSCLSRDNQNYIQSLYDIFLINPNSVEKEWRNFFFKICNMEQKPEYSSEKKYNFNIIDNNYTLLKKEKILQLVNSFRKDGHKNAKLDPLNLHQKKDISNLNLNFYNLEESDLNIHNNINFL
ncbi:MAG TPA: 2-oxoglutarate dehydrogenase E1 component, partial [Buchnera sp. (in: enterobacteria)]|nr:2-oxoglutarate dehydrogenase E1 component [Buchnera sp. (in: enterobacteria)]